MSDQPVPPASEEFTPAPSLTADQAAERAGLDIEVARRVWRALGMPEPSQDEVLFEDRDVEALVGLRRIMELGIPLQDLLSITRLYGTALSRIADAETRLFRQRLLGPILGQEGGQAAVDRLRPVVDALLERSAQLLDQAHRRHLSVALDALRAGDGQARSEPLAAAFVDLVDFSRISDDLPGEDLTGLIEAFEAVAVEACADAGVRLVKVIGDAAMFVSPDARAALAAASAVVGRAGRDLIPEARAGLDFGDVVPQGGDYFGRPVNVAARITAFARPGTVVVSGEFVGAVGDDLDVSRIGRRSLKGVGRVELFKVRHDEVEAGGTASEG